MPSYCCLNCCSLFLTERSRDDHIKRVHIQHEVEHRCPKCFGLFKSAINLKKHFERYHPSTIIPVQIMATEDKFDDESIEDLSKELIEDEKQLFLKMVKYFYKNWKEQTMELNRCTAENKLLLKQNQVLKRRITVFQRQLKDRNEELCNTLKISHRLMRERGHGQ